MSDKIIFSSNNKEQMTKFLIPSTYIDNRKYLVRFRLGGIDFDFEDLEQDERTWLITNKRHSSIYSDKETIS